MVLNWNVLWRITTGRRYLFSDWLFALFLAILWACFWFDEATFFDTFLAFFFHFSRRCLTPLWPLQPALSYFFSMCFLIGSGLFDSGKHSLLFLLKNETDLQRLELKSKLRQKQTINAWYGSRPKYQSFYSSILLSDISKLSPRKK